MMSDRSLALAAWASALPALPSCRLLSLRDPTPLPIETFDLHCDCTIRPRRLAEQFKGKMDRVIGTGDLDAAVAIVDKARTRWGGHTDLQVELTSLRVYQAALREELGADSTKPTTARARAAARTAVLGCGFMGCRVAAEMALCGHIVTVYDICDEPLALDRIHDALVDGQSGNLSNL
jgi:NADPH-dependent 2,4-dienoyl-CoA reductase/sulfur reductase-like enzyme